MTPTRAPPQAHDRHHDFIKQFYARQSQKAQDKINKQKKHLTATQRAALRMQLEKVHFLQPAHADSTKVNIVGLLRKWIRYCEAAQLGHWKAVIMKADRATAMDFLHHLCAQYGIKSWGTSWEYFRQYKQLYSSVTGRYMNTNDSKEVKKWHDATLVSYFGLRAPNVNGKEVASSDTLLRLLTYNIAYDVGIFALECHCVQLMGCYLFLACTGARPAEIVDHERQKPKDGLWEELYQPAAAGDRDHDRQPNKKAVHPEYEVQDENSQLLDELLTRETSGRGRPKALCYEDILLMVVNHPVTGEDMLVMSLKLIHHKGADSKPKPTIFYFTPTRRLIFCLILVIISLAIDDQAFAAVNLKTVRSVFEVRNTGPVKCTPLHWKPEWLKRPVMRRVDDGIISEYDPVPYHKLKDDLARQSMDAGEEKAVEPKAFRRGAANVANGDAPDATRDQMMRHDPKWATFNSAYINEKVQFHLQNAVLDEPREEALIGLMTHIGVMRDPRASSDMVPDEVWANLPPDPEIVQLEQRRELLKAGQYRFAGQEDEEEIRALTKQIRSMEAQCRMAISKMYREYYFHNRPTWDIERQASGEAEEQYNEPKIELCITERAELAMVLCHQSEDLSDQGLQEQRIRAAELMTALCNKRETARQRRIRQRVQAGVVVKQETEVFPLLMQKTQCPVCIGDEGLTYEERTFSYCRTAVMNDHFEKRHLEQNQGIGQRGQSITCKHPSCSDVELRDLDHFRNHVATKHGVILRPSEQVKRR